MCLQATIKGEGTKFMHPKLGLNRRFLERLAPTHVHSSFELLKQMTEIASNGFMRLSAGEELEYVFSATGGRPTPETTSTAEFAKVKMLLFKQLQEQ